jgi:hypothetical protein
MQHLARHLQRLDTIRASSQGFVVNDFPHQTQHMAPSLGRRNVLLDAIRIEQQPHLIAVANRGKSEETRHLAGQLALALGAGAKIAGGTDIDHQ